MIYFRNYFDRVKATKKLAREQNVPLWIIPFVNACGVLLLTAVYMSVYTLLAIVDLEKNMQYVPIWWTMLAPMSDWLPLIYFAILSLTLMDRVLTVIIIVQASITKMVYQGIQKVDHKIWRKTGKDSFIADKIWHLQRKWQGLDKRIRWIIIIQFIIAFISWRYFF